MHGNCVKDTQLCLLFGIILNNGYICGARAMLPVTHKKDEKTMAKIGDVCPLFFNPPGKDAFGVDGCYTQMFHSTDVILLQVLAAPGEVVEGTLNNDASGTSSGITFSTYNQNDGVVLHYASLSGLDDGVYTVTVDGIGESEPFEVCSSEDLAGRTVLFKYSNRDNNSFDDIFWIDGTQQFFYLRVEGGFKPEGYLPQVSNEQYRNQRQEIIELYSMPYDQWQLTIGDAEGVPVWVLRMINRILSLSHVEVNGRLYVRSEASVPEKTQTLEGRPLFQATVTLEPLENEVAGMGGVPEDGSGQSLPGFLIDNAKDGQMLQYDSGKAAFVNVTTVEV